ncbi:MAG: ribosomal protein S18 acetylase RimI-like enzyme [Cellvibrionaceae bacterium]|jgi:ribosomal protein S18 acetylase RimI-like enzyme
MNFEIKFAEPSDEPFLWEMLCEAAHMEGEDDQIKIAQQTPGLAQYVAGWGQKDDVGYIAVDPNTHAMMGAAWFRLFDHQNRGYGYVNDNIPELAIGTVSLYRGQGVGSTLIKALIDHATGVYAGLSLSVRDSNPAVHLYERVGFQEVSSSRTVNRVGGQSFTMALNFSS